MFLSIFCRILYGRNGRLGMPISMKKSVCIFFFSLLCSFFFAKEDENIQCASSKIDERLTHALSLKDDDVYEYSAFSLEFSHIHMQPRWVGYFISKERLESKKFARHGFSFTPDKNIKGGTANNEDYRKSGYDRGHLASARDMAFSLESLKESFLFSNICPQAPRLNRGKWLELEKFARKMAKKYGLIYVITGPIFSDEPKTIGNSSVAVPSHFFKALLFCSPENVQAVGFVMPNENLKEALSFFACSIDDMEEKASIDVFASLQDEIEEKAESSFDALFWFYDQESSILETGAEEE